MNDVQYESKHCSPLCGAFVLYTSLSVSTSCSVSLFCFQLRSTLGHLAPLYCLSYDATGQYIVSVSSPRLPCIRLHMHTLELLHIVLTHIHPVCIRLFTHTHCTDTLGELCTCVSIVHTPACNAIALGC